MGHFSMTCSISGLSISGGTAVRCLLLTASPYGAEDPRRGPWIVRTPPLRAVYDSYGSIEKIHEDDTFIANLWLRGLREDLIERGLGDNSVHDVPAMKDMTIGELLNALSAGRVTVRQDTKHFWHRPLLEGESSLKNPKTGTPSLRAIENVLSQDSEIVARFANPVARRAANDKFVIDEPVPGLVRVRFGHYQRGNEVLDALNGARVAIERAGFVGVVAAGSGRYANDAELLVLAAPNATEHVHGPRWSMAAGQAADPDKPLPVAMVMIREDVWHAIARYPHSERVALDCTSCGQESWCHDKGRKCPDKSVNGKPFKKHPEESNYTHGPLLPEAVEHIVATSDYGETLWYDLAAYKSGIRETWGTILQYFATRSWRSLIEAAKKSAHASTNDIEPWLQVIETAKKKELDRISRLSPEEHAKWEADQQVLANTLEAEDRRLRENPHFGDFLIDDFLVRDRRQPGAWIFHDSVPGVLGVSAHLSMCIADKCEVPPSVLDALAELTAIQHTLAAVGVTWKPSTSTGPQDPEWDQHLRFAQTVTAIVQAEYTRESNAEEGLSLDTCATLIKVQEHLNQKA